MKPITTTPSFKPKCPNHGCPLDGIPFPMPKKGEAVCPVSGAHFAYEVELDEETMVKDVSGNITKKVGWKFTGDE